MYSDYIILVGDSGQPYIAHHGIKGQKWGVRRYQNEDMTWTAAGKERYGNQNGNSNSPKRSFKGATHRMMAKVYGANERVYNKTGNKALASMNEEAKNRALKNAEEADRVKQEARIKKQEAKAKKKEEKKAYKSLSYKDKLKAQDYKSYSLKNTPFHAIGRNVVNTNNHWKKSIKNIREMDSGKGKALINAYLDQPLTVMGITGTSETTLRKRFSGRFNEWY